MNYKEFCTEFQRKIVEEEKWNIKKENVTFYENGYTSADKEELELIRNTNLKYHQRESDILIGDYVVVELEERENVKSICRFFMEYFYQEYEYEGWERVWKMVADNIKLSTYPNVDGVLAHIAEYEVIKDKLMIRPINYTDNRYELKNCIYKQYGDIALVLYIVLYDNKKIGLGTTKVHKSAFERWGKELDEVWETALGNTIETAPPRMYLTITECMNPPYERGAFMTFQKENFKIKEMQIPIITTTRQMNGAIAMFYPGVKEKLAELMDANYYVAFTSVHDVKIHCEGAISPKHILNSVKSVNQAFPKEDILSRKVFFYDRKKGTLEMLEL